jgi:nitric oxide reductase NorD protein
MGRIDIEPWEPEESIGKLWHAYASRLDAPGVHDGARVGLSEVAGRLAVLFRGLGGDPSVEVKAVSEERSGHRLTWLRRLGTDEERVPRASFDGASLRLPESLAVFPAREANGALYLWLAASAACAVPGRDRPQDPLARDLAALADARRMVAATLDEAPGLAALYRDLCVGVLALRPRPRLPAAEAAVEALICRMLGDETPLTPRAEVFEAAMESGDFSALRAPRGYRAARPVPLWPDLRGEGASHASAVETRDAEADPDGPTDAEQDGKTRRARRRKAGEIDRKDSFILHKFEAILSWAEFINLNRRVEDDDDDSARKAADDQDEIGLGQISQAPATRLKLHLDLAPEDVDREALSDVLTYPEWDTRTGRYLPAHARVLVSAVEPDAGTAPGSTDPRASARIRAVRKQFEALRPGRILTTGHPDGDDLDMERIVRARVDFSATGEGCDRVWMQTRRERRDLAVSILLDVSRSTEGRVTGHGGESRSVIEIAREALSALAGGLEACGDDFAINAFSSLRRQRVWLHRVKRFDEPMGPLIDARIAALKPGHYTRLGAAIRHASAELQRQARKRRLLLVITDGKPNDLDHYEGRHGIEDSHMAVREARRAGQSVFGITVDRDGKAWFPRMFGQGGYALIPHPDRLTQALPQIYRQLVGA